jgi:hypothetical protein
MPPEVREALEQLRQAFVARHGREPEPGDPLFPRLDPAYIFAFEKTGLLVTEQNQHLIPDEDLAEWDAAIEEYERKHRGHG